MCALFFTESLKSFTGKATVPCKLNASETTDVAYEQYVTSNRA